MSDKFNLPPELFQALGYAAIAEEFLDPIIGVAEKIHDMGLGKKAGKLLGLVTEELVDVFGPLTKLLDQRRAKMRNERMAFIAEQTKECASVSAEVKTETALAVLKMEHNEFSMLVKTIESEYWKLKAQSASSGGSKETWSLSSLGNLVKKN